MKRIFDPDFKYTPADKQGPDYLKKKFDKRRAELKKQAESKVTPIRKGHER